MCKRSSDEAFEAISRNITFLLLTHFSEVPRRQITIGSIVQGLVGMA